jgi:hypothetical protein
MVKQDPVVPTLSRSAKRIPPRLAAADPRTFCTHAAAEVHK